jgi:S1-C subfamily serine protease
MFRLLRRSEDQVEAIASLDESVDLMDDVHTNIIAGLAMDDGQTVAAWLPDADLEFGPGFFSPKAPRAPAQKPAVAEFPTTQSRNVHVPGVPFAGGMFGRPDLTVIGPDGRRLSAEYVGFDAATGLSILRLEKTDLAVDSISQDHPVGEGQNVRLISPEPAANVRTAPAGNVYVRMGTTFGSVMSIKQAPAGGGIARLKVRSPRLTSKNIGGIALNDAGETVGIVDAVDGSEATILPTALIQKAAKRVLAQHASVPRPWLGVKGEPVARVNVEQFKNQGWKLERAASLVEAQRGILLTSIAPDSPAATASLHAGDVILKVNDEDVENADDFSWMLDQAGPSSSVTFTLARPDRLTEEAVKVQLSGLLDPAMAFRFATTPAAFGSLISQGVETIALRPLVAAQLGALPGLLVVYVDPTSPAFAAGLQPGDVIESIDGARILRNTSRLFSPSTPAAKQSYEVVRKKQKIVVTLNSPDKN